MTSSSSVNNLRASSQDEPSQRSEVSAINTGNSSPLYYPLLESKNREKRMMEAQSGSHTVRSHGFTVARTHMHDWLILILLVVMDGILNIIHPFYRYVGKDMMSDLKFPLKSNTVPVWAVPIYAVLLPMVIFLIFYFRRRDVYDLHHGVLGLLFSVLITAVITDAIKDAVGRPRPDFFWRCFPDGKDIYDKWGNVICHGSTSTVREGHKSFPSGHTAWSFSGLGFLSLYLSGKIKAFDRGGHVAKLCIVFFPLLIASLVGISRVDDYWHHWQDVFAGGLIGLTIATFCYLQFFPPPYHSEGWGPYAYFRVLEESLVNGRVLDAANAHNTQLGVAQSELQQNDTCNTQLGVAQTEPRQNDRNFRGVASNGSATQQTVVDLEAGRS